MLLTPGDSDSVSPGPQPTRSLPSVEPGIDVSMPAVRGDRLSPAFERFAANVPKIELVYVPTPHAHNPFGAPFPPSLGLCVVPRKRERPRSAKLSQFGALSGWRGRGSNSRPYDYEEKGMVGSMSRLNPNKRQNRAELPAPSRSLARYALK